MSGGSSSGTSTQVQDVPEWAKPYAKTALSQASQLTDITKNPYQAYGGERTAQFTPLQQQSYQGAAAMQAGPQAFQSQVGQYMSPYMQNVVERQQLDASRQAKIAQQAQGAQSARMGAFGGSGDYLMRGQAAANLARQQGDIQAQGLQSAYTNATNQYNTGQQQNMAINQLQNQYGGQQQQQVQNILGQQYQDFQDQKRYPYQQLEFMSGLMRGTPMGTVSSMYQAPGSALGQVAGLGMGAYGLSQMGMKFADGGAVGYASGDIVGEDVDHPDNVAAIVHNLNDADLAKAEIAARARGDAEQIDAIEKEKAMRASERGGMAGAFNSLPDEQQQQMLAGGGMAVAFRKGGDEGESTYFQDPMGAPSAAEGRAPTGSDFLPDFRQNVTEGESYTPGLRGMLFGYDVKKPAPKEEKPKETPYDPSTATLRSDFEGKKPQISSTVKRGISELAASRGLSEDDLMESTKKMMAYFDSRSKPEMDKLQAMIDQGAGESKEIKEQALGRALAKYGFDWAAKASQPGARFLGSAAGAAPSIAESVAESQKLERESRQNQLKLNMSMQQFRIAQSKGDERAAMSWAQQVRQLKQFDQQLELKKQELGIHAAGVAQKGEQFKQIMGAKMASAGAQNKQAQARLAKVGTDAAFKYDESNRRTKDELKKLHGPVAGEAMYKLGRKQYINDAMQSTADSMSDAQSGGGGGGVSNYFDLMGMGE
jgi:hypothetical protein